MKTDISLHKLLRVILGFCHAVKLLAKFLEIFAIRMIGSQSGKLNFDQGTGLDQFPRVSL